jgi:hypothetical protein
MLVSTPDQSTIKALIKATRAFVDSFEAELGLGDGGAAQEPASTAPTFLTQTGGVVFDPLKDEPPSKPDPVGTGEQKKMAYLTYLSAIYAINTLKGRGATPVEVARYAVKAGYGDARGVSGFSNGRGATYSKEDGTRWVTPGGVLWLQDVAEELGIVLPEDLTGPAADRHPC